MPVVTSTVRYGLPPSVTDVMRRPPGRRRRSFSVRGFARAARSTLTSAEVCGAAIENATGPKASARSSRRRASRARARRAASSTASSSPSRCLVHEHQPQRLEERGVRGPVRRQVHRALARPASGATLAASPGDERAGRHRGCELAVEAEHELVGLAAVGEEARALIAVHLVGARRRGTARRGRRARTRPRGRGRAGASRAAACSASRPPPAPARRSREASAYGMTRFQ